MAEKSNHKVIKEVEMIKILCGSSKKRFSQFKAAINKLETDEEKLKKVLELVSFLADAKKVKENNLEEFAMQFFIEYGPLISRWLQRRNKTKKKMAISKENKEITLSLFRTLYDMGVFENASETDVVNMIKQSFSFGDSSRYLLREFLNSKVICKSKTIAHIEKFLVIKKSA